MSVFGKEFEQIWPKAGSQLKLTEFGRKLLKNCESIKKPESQVVDINEFKRKSSNFPLEFGTNTCRVLSQPKDRYPLIQKQIASAYPVIHERVLQLYLDFLEHKCKYGFPLEKQLYAKLSLTDFVQRLLIKRCATFMGSKDYYLLLSREICYAGNNYINVGTPQESKPLILEDLISYDEVKLSAFLSVSSLTELLNDGCRSNKGIIEKNLSIIEREGVVVGIIGARFEKPFVMEYQDILITKEQNVREKGYGFNTNNSITEDDNLKRSIEYRKLWQTFYESIDFLYDEVPQHNSRFSCIPSKEFPYKFSYQLDNVMMKKRYAITFDTLLLESQARASKLNKQAYIHIVGIGLGVWKIAEQQTKIFLECFSQRVKHLLPQLNNIGVLHFSWFHMQVWQDLKHNGFIESKTHPLGGIRTFLVNRNPAEKLKDEFKDMLLIISYAWDGNALPGNEFWVGSLSGSNDASTACSTLITELHNPHINNVYVNGENLHVASGEYGVLHVKDFAQKVFEREKN